jgi:hypothetical protein
MYFSEIYSVFFLDIFFHFLPINKDCFLCTFQKYIQFFLDIFFHFLYLFKMWEIFMPYSVSASRCFGTGVSSSGSLVNDGVAVDKPIEGSANGFQYCANCSGCCLNVIDSVPVLTCCCLIVCKQHGISYEILEGCNLT